MAIVSSSKTNDAVDTVKNIEKMGVEAMVCPCDVSNPEDVMKMVDSVVGRWGPIHILVCSAGMSHVAPAEDLTFEEWQRMMDVNLTGVFLCNQAVGKKMIHQKLGGSIVNISSMSAHIVNIPQKQCHYNTAKAGVSMFTKCLAVEWAEHGIRVNAVSPGYIRTKLVEFATEFHSQWIEKIPMKRMGEPEDIAHVVAYLASPKAKYVTGADWVVDGGYLCV